MQSGLFAVGLVIWFGLLSFAEFLAAVRRPANDRTSDRRLITNFGLTALVLASGNLLALSKLGSAAVAESAHIGLAQHVQPPWLATLAILLIVDSFAIYWTHRLMHAVPLLWRIHRVHHSDNAVDVSTSLRNHPLELLVVTPVSTAVILMTGAPASVVIVGQTLGIAAILLQHADIDLPEPFDRTLSMLIVTPRLHRLHHNPDRQLHDSNFGELVTWWDRLFGTFRPGRPRGRVGLDCQVAPPDALLRQIWSPIYQV